MAADLESASEKLSSSENSRHDQPDGKLGQNAIEHDEKDSVVDWDGPDDPSNPMNWPAWKRLTQVIIASAFLLTA